MSDRIELLLPIGESTAAPGARPQLAPRLRSLAGATIGIVGNGWHCMDVLTRELQRILVAEHGVKEVVALATGTTYPMRESELLHARDHWDAAIVGLGT
ncbi:MAG: hypothetical protein ACKVQU_29745 [Burkholderiales bacterium]